jgi:peptidoglycan/LPS O-acetylase OafA/YrhL
MNPALSAFRFYLAMSVVGSHFAGPGIWGDGAVEAFFAISGFLVTLIVNEQYAQRPRAYLLNRFLRIYPVYWACLLIGAAAIALFPAAALVENSSLAMPATAHDIFSQIAIFGLDRAGIGPTAVRILPPAWSLNVELYFYLIIGLFTATRPRLTLSAGLIALVVSCLAAAKIVPLPFYGDPLGNAQPFFLGSLAYHLKDRIDLRGPGITVVFAIFAFLQLLPTDRYLEARVETLSLVAPFAVIATWKADRIVTRWRGELDLLGKLSYPIFLLHWAVSVPLRAAQLSHGTIFLFCVPLTILAALAVHLGVERPIEVLRRTIRSGASQRPAPYSVPS